MNEFDIDSLLKSPDKRCYEHDSDYEPQANPPDLIDKETFKNLRKSKERKWFVTVAESIDFTIGQTC